MTQPTTPQAIEAAFKDALELAGDMQGLHVHTGLAIQHNMANAEHNGAYTLAVYQQPHAYTDKEGNKQPTPFLVHKDDEGNSQPFTNEQWSRLASTIAELVNPTHSLTHQFLAWDAPDDDNDYDEIATYHNLSIALQGDTITLVLPAQPTVDTELVIVDEDD